jgi:hypothetical protein
MKARTTPNTTAERMIYGISRREIVVSLRKMLNDDISENDDVILCYDVMMVCSFEKSILFAFSHCFIDHNQK